MGLREDIIRKVKEKKSLDKLGDSYVEKFLDIILRREDRLRIKLNKNILKEKDKEKIIKLTRNELNKRYGQFWKKYGDIISHKSSDERKEIYEEVYKKIFSITGKPRTLLDIGAGVNTLSYDLIGKEVYYYVNELTLHDCEYIRKYLSDNNFKFEIIIGDITELNDFPKTDVCFMFKLLDSLDVKGHKITEELIKKLRSKYIVVSFSNLGINNRKMNFPRRKWFEAMLKRLSLEFEKVEFTSESFYIIKKS